MCQESWQHRPGEEQNLPLPPRGSSWAFASRNKSGDFCGQIWLKDEVSPECPWRRCRLSHWQVPLFFEPLSAGFYEPEPAKVHLKLSLCRFALSGSAVFSGGTWAASREVGPGPGCAPRGAGFGPVPLPLLTLLRGQQVDLTPRLSRSRCCSPGACSWGCRAHHSLLPSQVWFFLVIQGFQGITWQPPCPAFGAEASLPPPALAQGPASVPQRGAEGSPPCVEACIWGS